MANYLTKPKKCSVSWERIKLLILDCDGVLTDGRIIYGAGGNDIKCFDASDGMGLMLLRHIDLPVGVISGRKSEALAQRCKDIQIKYLYQEIPRKIDCVKQLLAELSLSFDNLIYMGDDWNDLPCMRRAALSVAPHSAHPAIQKVADMVTAGDGGRGAVRELIDYILLKKGVYERAITAYVDSIS